MTSFGTYNHVEKIVFPYYNEPEKSTEEILEKIHHYLQYLCNRVMDSYMNDDDGDGDDDSKRKQIFDPNRIKIDEIWDIHRIKQFCKTKNKLLDVLGSSSDFTLINNNEMLVHKKYQLDNNDDRDHKYNHDNHDYHYNEDDYYDDDDVCNDDYIYHDNNDEHNNYDSYYDEYEYEFDSHNEEKQNWITITNDYNNDEWKSDSDDDRSWKI